jgi:hypothetical protein
VAPPEGNGEEGDGGSARGGEDSEEDPGADKIVATAERAAGAIQPKATTSRAAFGSRDSTCFQMIHMPKPVSPTSRSNVHAVVAQFNAASLPYVRAKPGRV